MPKVQKSEDLSPDIHVEEPPENAFDPTHDLSYRLNQQRLTADFGYFALKSDDLQEVLQEATRIASLGMKCQFAKVLEHKGAKQGFLVCAGTGWHPGVVGHATVGDDLESPAGYAFHVGKPVISNHLEQEQRFRTPSLLAEHGVKRAINVLIQTEDEKFGVLEVDSPDEGQFDEADTAFLETFANLLAVAIKRRKIDAALLDNQQKLKQAIEHQDVLAREISHRVKNSLTMVGGLLDMQARSSDDERSRQALGDARSRVYTIASVHDQLWRSEGSKIVGLKEFISDPAAQLASVKGGHSLTIEIDDITVIADQAVTIGLLVNELVTSALKYAYDGAGEVEIVVLELADGKLQLTVADHGRGLPPDFDQKKSKGLGMKLIGSPSRQLGGAPNWYDANPGTGFELLFQPAMNEG